MNEQQQVQSLVAGVVKELATHGVRLQFIRAQPLRTTGRQHIELLFEGRCDKSTFDSLKKLNEDNIAGLALVNQQTRHNDAGEFDPSLGFIWTFHAELKE